MSCAAPPTGSGFLAATLANFDCQAQSIGEAGYQTLASTGSPVALALTSLLAIFIAIIGIRFLTAKPLTIDEWIATALKVGFVMALATSWPAYRTVVYDVVLKGPAEISASIGKASALPGSAGGLAARLSAVDSGIMALVEVGSGRTDVSSRRLDSTIAPPLSEDASLGWGKTLFVGSIIGSFGLLRLAGGIFIALAPLFAGFLLFEATRFLFFGWLRSLIAISIGSIGTAIVIGVELAVIEPWLAQVLALRAARVATLAAPFELLALTIAFSVAMVGMLVLALKIAYASAAAVKVQALIEHATHGLHSQNATWHPNFPENPHRLAEQGRAQLLAQSVRQTLDREGGQASRSSNIVPANRTLLPNGTASTLDRVTNTPLGRSYHAPSRRVGSQALKRRSTT
ncbi:MAG: type IV secretion system protein [Sphingomonadales bacterium]